MPAKDEEKEEKKGNSKEGGIPHGFRVKKYKCFTGDL